MKVLGLIGAIGAGKSAAASILATLGGDVVDADRIGHAVLDDVADTLVARWGDRVVENGRVNRKAIAGIVFGNEVERKALEAIVYPEIHRRCRERIDASSAAFVVLDAAVMQEAGWTLVDKIVYIDAPRSLRLERVKERGWDQAQLTAREAAQWPAERKIAAADVVIMNDGSLAALEHTLRDTLAAWGWI